MYLRKREVSVPVEMLTKISEMVTVGETKRSKPGQNWELCFVCKTKLTEAHSLLCPSCSRRHHRRCRPPSWDKSDQTHCNECGADLAEPVVSSKSVVNAKSETNMNDEVKEQIEILSKRLEQITGENQGFRDAYEQERREKDDLERHHREEMQRKESDIADYIRRKDEEVAKLRDMMEKQ
ncbi:MAG: hypothetical protein GY820_35585 [Gammaproteobacteria bacterium]|nr:hypothetical protein [Gammaproteobacteria bacterium]